MWYRKSAMAENLRANDITIANMMESWREMLKHLPDDPSDESVNAIRVCIVHAIEVRHALLKAQNVLNNRP